MATDDRDQQFERALARHLRESASGSACPDPEILAAYHERTLSLEGMASWKQHIAGCSRCQEALAFLEQTENLCAEEWERDDAVLAQEPHRTELQPTLASRYRDDPTVQNETVPPIKAASPDSPARLRWRWAASIGAIAAAVIVWVGVREVHTQHKLETENAQMALNRQTAPEPPLPSPAAKLKDELKTEASPAKSPAANTKLISPAPSQASGSQSVLQQSQGYSPITSAPSFTTSDQALQQRETQNAAMGKVAVPKATVPAERAPARVSSGQPAPSPLPPSAAPAATADAGIAGGALGGIIANAKKSEPPPATSQSVNVEASNQAVSASSTELAINGRNYSQLLMLAAGDQHYIVAPGEQHAWRVGLAGKIERSTDRGKSWKLQRSGVTFDLTSGSATSDKICWAVGKAGTLLLTTDGGKHWKSLSSPIIGDLGGVHAIDALHASIWDVPNRKSFQTSDGGATWTQTSNE